VRPPETPLQAALTYAANGWTAFPCHTIASSECSCGAGDCHSPGKHPLTRRGLHDATSDRDQLRVWWRRNPDANVAIRTGEQSGLVVLDVDPDHDGIASLRTLVDQYGKMPAGPRVRTGSGGWHLYFAHPGAPIRNSAGTRFGPGIDIRGDGGYVIAPPSQHRSGASYEWRGLELDVPELPGWVLERVTLSSERPSSRPDTSARAVVSDAWARAALHGETQMVAAAPEGTRNHTLNRAAFCLGQIVATGVLDITTVETALLASASSAGLGESESQRTVRSGIAAGIAHPRVGLDAGRTQPTRTTPLRAEPDCAMELG
jgi:Bifunctional DNA primase/polymerase, N-terminal.